MLEALTSPILIWFIIGLVLILAEFAVPGVILVFFGAGAWVVSLACVLAGVPLQWQLFIFLISSVFFLVFLRARVKKIFVGHSREGETDLLPEEFVGLTGCVVQRIQPGAPGRVEFRGTQWKAESGQVIEEGAPVEIVEKNNITLVVKPTQRR